MSTALNPKKAKYQKQWERFGYAMISPGMIFLILVTTVPLVSLLVMSVFRIDLTYPPGNGWIGLENYFEMMNDGRFWYSIRLTAIYTAVTVVLQVVVGLGLAMAFFRGFRGQGLLRVSVLLPMILAPVVVGLAWRTLILTLSCRFTVAGSMDLLINMPYRTASIFNRKLIQKSNSKKTIHVCIYYPSYDSGCHCHVSHQLYRVRCSIQYW